MGALEDQSLELFAAIFVAAELVEAGKPGTEEHLVAARGRLRGLPDRLGQARAPRVGKACGGASRREGRSRLSNEKNLSHPRGDPANKSAHVAALGLAPGDQPSAASTA